MATNFNNKLFTPTSCNDEIQHLLQLETEVKSIISFIEPSAYVPGELFVYITRANNLSKVKLSDDSISDCSHLKSSIDSNTLEIARLKVQQLVDGLHDPLGFRFEYYDSKGQPRIK